MDTLLSPLYYVVSYIMVAWHWVFDLLLPQSLDGWAWLFSIIGLVATIRALLIPLFVKQIKSSRKMQILQPQMKDLQKKYGHDKQRLQQEMMKLYSDNGTNPFASCLPMLVQLPVFFALFRVLNGASGKKPIPHGAFNQFPDLFENFRAATIGGIHLHDSFRYPGTESPLATQILAGFLVVIMVSTTYFTQHQLMRKNMPQSALQGPMAQQMKIMMYVLPLGFLFSGWAFPIACVLYWCLSNLWTMVQQYYVIRNMPSPGTAAEAAYNARMAAKEAKRTAPGGVIAAAAVDDSAVVAVPEAQVPTRQQPRKQTRSQRKKR